MLVVIFMASNALLGSILEHRTLVAVFALGLVMLTKQGEVAGLVVELDRFFPTALNVAARAVLAQRSFVLIVFFMARKAGLLKFDLVEMPFVTLHTFDIAVLGKQPVFCVRVMIECIFLPVVGRMTVLALVAKLTFVPLFVIVFFMAAYAVQRGIPVIL